MVEATLVAIILESLRAQQPEEESTAAVGNLGDDERAALTTDRSAVVPEATAGTAGPSGAEAGVADDALESRATKPVVLGEQAAPPEAS